MGTEVKAKGDVRHLDHFVLAVMDANRAEKFYSEILGARTLKRFDSPNMNRVFMKLGENHVGLFSQGKTTLPKRDSAASYPRHSFIIPEAEFGPMVEKLRRASSFVKDIQNEKGLGCCWNEGLVFQDSEGNFLEIAKAKGINKPRLHHLHFDTTDLDASINFYKSILNFSVVEQRNGFAVTDDNFHEIVDKLHRAGIDEHDDHGEREGRRPGQLGTYFREPSGFRLQITNEDSATFALHAND